MKKCGLKELWIIIALLIFLLTGCGSKAQSEQTAQNSAPALTVISETPSVQEQTPEPEKTVEPEQTADPEETVIPEQTEAPAETAAPEQSPQPAETDAPSETPVPGETPQVTDDPNAVTVEEDGEYSDKEHVALYIHTYGHLPSNYVTKEDAKAAGWDSGAGNLIKVLPGKSIGGDRYGNYEGLLPKAKGRKYYECDINYNPKGKTSGRVTRGPERIVYSNDGLIYYTADHYNTFEQLY